MRHSPIRSLITPLALVLALAGAEAAAAATPSPASLDFGGQSMMTTSPALVVTLTNNGTVAEAITSITTAAPFAVATSCTSIAASGGTCTASVTFTPTAQGALAGTLTIVGDSGTQALPLAGTGEKSLVTHYYRSILQRAPDTAGKAFWDGEAARLSGLGINTNETWYAMALGFFTSAEYLAFNRTDAQFVGDLYKTFFNRAADQVGTDYWTGQIAAGMPREIVLISFLFSPEFTAFTQGIFGNTAARPEVDVVTDFYRGILGRLPDSAGFSTWLGLFRNAQCVGATNVGVTADSISSGFLASSEYTARNRTDAQFVGDLYNAFLRRGGDLAGVQFWLSQLASGAKTRSQLRVDFLNSTEFSARIAAVIAAGAFPGLNCGGVELDLSGRIIPSPTGFPGAVMCDRNGASTAPYPGGGPGPCGSYEIPVGNCTSGMTGANAITRAFEYILEDIQPGSLRLGNSMRLAIPRDAAMVFRFKTGPATAFPELAVAPFYRNLTIGYDEQVSRGPAAPHFATISETRCDFDYSKTLSGSSPTVLNGCYVNMSSSGSMLAKVWAPASLPATPAADFPFCPLKPDTTYYLNIRYEDASTTAGKGLLSCQFGACGAAIGFN